MKHNTDIDIFFLGDTYYGEWHMNLRARKGKYNVLAEKGYLHFAQPFVALLNAGDLVVANLECAITDIPESPLKSEKAHTYAANEEHTIAALKQVNVSLVTLANNHAADFGKAGLVDTLTALEQHGISYIGGGKNLQAAQQPHLFSKQCGDKECSVALVSCFDFSSYAEKWGFYATEAVPGVSRFDAKHLAAQVQEVKARKADTLFIAIPHWGPNYAWRTFDQQQQAEKLVEAGVDAVIGHSAHMIQEVEYIKDRLIVYSIGNFIMNGDGEYPRRNLPPYSFIARLNISSVDGRLKQRVLLYPFVCDNTMTDFTPRYVSKAEFEHVAMILMGHNFHVDMFEARLAVNKDEYGYYFECGMTGTI